ncbi:MAG TPA: hypothetical protein VER36_10345 [Flavisolibacter sp.]|nr:hypothetical protein [Flavisolibacter sp.]
MDTKGNNFEEQDHPLKNTDNAFVKVGKNGEPVIPKEEENKEREHPEKDGTTTIGHQ